MSSKGKYFQESGNSHNPRAIHREEIAGLDLVSCILTPLQYICFGNVTSLEGISYSRPEVCLLCYLLMPFIRY